VIRAALLFLLCFFANLSFAQSVRTFTITPPGEGGFSYIIQKPDESKAPLPIEGKSVEAAAPEDPNGYRVYVIDTSINRAASADLIKVLKTKKFTPKSDEFTLVAETIFQLNPKSGTVPAANLKVTSGKEVITKLITAQNNNQASIRFLPNSVISYEITYEIGSNQSRLSGMVDATKTAGAFTIDIPFDAEFSSSDKSGVTNETSAAPKPSDAKNPFVSLLQNLIGLALVGGLAYAGYWYYKNNQKVVEKLADQAGLKPQDPADPTGALPADPPKKDLQKIVLQDSSLPKLGEGQGGVVTPTIAVTKNPRLVTPEGNIHLIPEGTQSIGRESADLTLAGESSVSRSHAQITRDANQITVSDSGSTNGTYINGTKITSPTVLNPGDTVQFGTVSFRYEE
jgi:hypothetical protein